MFAWFQITAAEPTIGLISELARQGPTAILAYGLYVVWKAYQAERTAHNATLKESLTMRDQQLDRVTEALECLEKAVSERR